MVTMREMVLALMNVPKEDWDAPVFVTTGTGSIKPLSGVELMTGIGNTADGEVGTGVVNVICLFGTGDRIDADGQRINIER